jgi:serine/threonine protein kinase
MEDYRELQCIGRGSQGAVYAVRHLVEGRLYVMKRMHILEPEARRTALCEAETLHRLQHTAIVGYRDSFLDDEDLCIVMEYCEGGDLAARLAARHDSPLTEEQLLQWLVQLALALHHVHDRGVLHRDIKSHNVFVTQKGQLKLGDFGIAKLHLSYEDLSATCVGTPYYMSPEQFRGEPYGQKADVWALGCVFYETCTRRRAFDAPNLASLSMQVGGRRGSAGRSGVLAHE